METSIQTLLSRLVTGPAFMLLGQALEERQAASGAERIVVLSDVGPQGNDAPAEAEYERFDREVRTIEPPGWLSEAAQYPWNGIFTSRVDSSLPDVFVSEWRRVVPTAQVFLGRHPRSATEMQVRFLFGGMGLPEEERPPTDVIQKLESKARAAEMLQVLAESLVTPRGVIVIEGYQPGDWLTTQDLFTFVNRLQAGQAHLFSATETLLEDTYIRAAIDRGTLVAHGETFSTVLNELETSGRFQRMSAGRGMAGQRLIPVGDGFAEVDVSTWNRVIGAARPVDNELLEPFSSASSALKYQRFRTFLGASEGSPPWRAVASGYNLRRDFEEVLLRRVQSSLDELSMPEPIIIAGQTATGKTIALCSLALQVARSGQAAVLHRSRLGDRPTLADIDAFASWADENYSIPTLFVWDGMVDIDEYYTLQRQLRSRGRRVLIVGSGYLPPQHVKKVIRVDPGLSETEVARVEEWLRAFDVPVPDDIGRKLDSSFLALLYRVIPETERGLRRGLTREMREAEIGLEKLSKAAEKTGVSRVGAVAQALADAGFDIDTLSPSERPHAELIDLSFEERSSTEQLTSMVLVAGRRGLIVPLELVLRILGREGSSRVVELVRNFDIFRWTEDERGSQYLGARTQLEAELLAREDLNVRTEVEVTGQMIENLRPVPSRGGGEEVQFIVDLMEGMGPQSRDSARYEEHYLYLADAFVHLRERSGPAHHRLVLLEANLTREHVLWAQKHNVSSSAERIELLRHVKHLLETTLEEADASPRSRLNLLVELASTNGAQVFELSQQGEPSNASAISALMSEVTRAALSARAYDPENVYPVDVVAWTTRRAVETGVLSEETRIDLLANAQASLDSIDPGTLSPARRATYDQRCVEMARMLNDAALEAQHLAALTENNDPAAYYFLARSAARSGPEGIKVAVESLLQASIEVRSDWRCSRLLLDLFWELKAGKPFLRGERQTLAFTEADWSECLRIADAIPIAGDFDRYRLDFLRGLSLFHLGSYRASEEVFRRLDRESQDLSSRIVSAYLASASDGNASVFTGRVVWATPDGRRGIAWVDQLHIEVPFIPQRFSVTDFRRKGDVLPSFHIAFNMRGALAELIRAVYRGERQAPDAQ